MYVEREGRESNGRKNTKLQVKVYLQHEFRNCFHRWKFFKLPNCAILTRVFVANLWVKMVHTFLMLTAKQIATNPWISSYS